MRTWIPWEEIEAEWMKRPGFAEACEQARREIDEEIAMYGTIGNPKSPMPAVFARKAPKRKPRAFSTKLTRTRATVL